MPTDAKFPFEHDDTGDLSSVSGEEFYQRHILQLGLVAAGEHKGSPSTANDAIELQSEIRKLLTSSPYISSPVRVSISDIENETVTAEVNVPEVDTFEIPLDEPDA